ncbi:GMC oxidoreductase [Paenibacillus sp. LjRoot56]|uniref:GMC oxidoreductase n=1 Tax=Paenibacillus sp. LjRoot56 TaxID=3342333 RepID=UPI003F4F87EF
MRIYIADHYDTLVTISQKLQVGLLQMMSVNPHIASPDTIITGERVNLPATNMPESDNRIFGEFCPPVPESEFLREWIPITSAEQMAQTEYDVLIVGTGAGGGAALWRLAEQWGNNGKKIGVVERGDISLPTHCMNIATINGDNFRILRPYNITYPIGKRLPQLPGAKLIYTLGGRTLLWGAIAPRMPDHVLARWPVSIQEMNIYYNIAEELMSVTRAYTKDSSITQNLLNRLRENGFENADNIPVAADLDQTRFGKIHSNVFYSTIVSLARALAHRPFDLAVNTYVTEVVTDLGKAVGVRVMTPDKISHFIKAKTIVLSASALQTPRILLNSKIPGRAIGRYLINHSYLIATASVNTRGFSEPLGVLGIIIPQHIGHPYQLQLQGPEQYFNYQYEQKPIKDLWKISFYGASGEVESRYENRVYVDPLSRDAYGVPEIQVNFTYSEKDEAVIRQMSIALQQASRAMQLELATTQNGTPEICLMPIGTDNHESGTCRMGDDPQTSATNRYGQIHGISGLYIADGSVLPSIGATNTTLSIVALAIRTADYIIKSLQES